MCRAAPLPTVGAVRTTEGAVSVTRLNLLVILVAASGCGDPAGEGRGADVDVVPVESARDMHDAVAGLLPAADISIFAAAVADFRPAGAFAHKVKRGETGPTLSVELVANPDIAAETRPLRKAGSVAVGFALETQDLLANAARKLEAKGFDLLVANDATAEGSGFDVDTNRVTILGSAGEVEELPLQSKDEVADAILDRVIRRLDVAR